MPTALQLIESAALKLGAIESGEALTADEAADSLSALNSMLEFWSTNSLLVYQIVQNSHSWASGNASRTIGTSGDFNTTRPLRIEEGTYFRDSFNLDLPVKILRDRAAYDAISLKSTQSTYPEYLFYDPAYPLGVLYAYPVPSSALTLRLNSWQTLQNFAALTTDLALPPGYQYTIENNLACELEPIFGVPVPPRVERNAMLSRNGMMRINHVPVTSNLDVAGVVGATNNSRYNINADY